jgi:MATE family multidrug resistance protein
MTVQPRLLPTRGELREMVRLATPIVAVNLGMMLQGTVDTIMLGHDTPVALAAGAVGNLYFFNVIVIGMGLLMSLDPIVAQAIGARDAEATARGVQRGIVLALLTAVIAAIAMLPAGAVLRALDQPEEVITGAASYARWSAIGVIPWQLFNACRQTLQAMHRVAPLAAAVVIANVVNALLAWILIFGKFGAPAMGVVGAAHATWISRWLMLFLIVWFSWRDLRPALLRMVRLGAPIGLQWFAEGFAFGFSGIVIGWIGALALAGHQITLTIASLTFMVPMGVAGAGAAMVGRAIGANDIPAARRAALAALTCGVGFMAAMAALMVSLPGTLSTVFTRDAATIAIAVTLIPIAGVFQIFDGTQVVAAAILRGAGDTRVPMLLHTLSFWALGIPLGLLLAFPLKLGAPGLWWGLTAGLASAAVLQVARVRAMLRRDISRVVVD